MKHFYTLFIESSVLKNFCLHVKLLFHILVAIKGEDVCFKANDDGDQYGHCGVDDRDQFVACAPE